jgi:ankyrin repeat protein
LVLACIVLGGELSSAMNINGFDRLLQQSISVKPAKKKNEQEIQQFGKAKGLIIKGDLTGFVKFLDENVINLQADGATLLRIAAQEDKPLIIEELLKRGVDVNAKSKSTGTNALIGACIYGKTNIVKLLLSKGAQINESSFNGSTPLIWGYKHKEIVQMLILNGANVNIKNLDGNTALAVAVANRNHDVVNLLLTNKADLMIKDKQGRTVIDLARITGDKKMIRLIENATKK